LYVPLVQRIINSSYHSALGCSPSHLLYGGRIDLDRGLIFRKPSSQSLDNHDSSPDTSAAQIYWNKVIENHELIEKASIDFLAKTISYRTQRHNNNNEITSFQNGDLVLVAKPYSRFNQDGADKLSTHLTGPVRVISRKDGTNSYVVQDLNSEARSTININRLSLFDSSRTDPANVAAADRREWIVEKIVAVHGDYSRRHDQRIFQVKWLNFPDSHNSWISAKEAKQLSCYEAFINSLRT